MAQGKQKGLKSGTEVKTWQARLAASGLMFDRLYREREEYIRALALGDGVRDWSIYANVRAAQAGDSGFASQNIPLSYRYAIWLQAQSAGDPPVIKYPRNAAGDETFAVTIEDLLLRVWIESGAMREWQQAVFSLCGFGSSCVWHGFHGDIVSLDEVEGAAEGVEGTVARALQGDPTALPGQDRALAQHALTTALQDPVNRVALPMEAQQGLAMAAGQQIDAGVKEAKKPQLASVENREIWSRRLMVGRQVRWDHTVSDVRDADWMARRIVMKQEQAKKSPQFSASARSKIVLTPFSKHDGVELVKDVATLPENSPENGRFVFWEIWDKCYGTRHYVAEGVDEYLEESEAYPFPHPQTGRPAIPGFFPASICAPSQHDLDIPERTAGTPLIAPGYPLQREITSLHNFAMDSVKRHSIRGYEAHPSISKDTLDEIVSGEDAFVVQRPEGVEKGEMLIPIQFTGEAYRIVDLIGRLTGEWSMLMGMPMADLTSQPQADTATAEQIGVASGRSQADHVMRQIEASMAHSVEVIRAMLSIGLYPPEKLAALLGPGREQVVAAWQSTSLEGDHIILKSASRAKAEQVVRTKQLGDALALTVGFMDPMTGLPVYDASPIVEEILLALDVGRPKRIQWPPKVQQAAAMNRMMMAAGGGGAQPPGEGGEGKPPDRGAGEQKRKEGPPDAAHEGAAARRT